MYIQNSLIKIDFVALFAFNWKRHIQSKHEKLPIKCKQCDKIYFDKRILNVHIKSVHENVRYYCDKCEKSFPLKKNLDYHMRAAHKSENEKRRVYCTAKKTETKNVKKDQQSETPDVKEQIFEEDMSDDQSSNLEQTVDEDRIDNQSSILE